jgi:hypothetical protein
MHYPNIFLEKPRKTAEIFMINVSQRRFELDTSKLQIKALHLRQPLRTVTCLYSRNVLNFVRRTFYSHLWFLFREALWINSLWICGPLWDLNNTLRTKKLTVKHDCGIWNYINQLSNKNLSYRDTGKLFTDNT